MNILSIGGRYKPTNGGNAKRISTMCEAFFRAGHSVTVMTCDGYEENLNEQVIANVVVKRYLDYDKLVADVLQVISSFSIDIILVHEETYLRKIEFLKLKVPVVYECHAIEPNKSKVKEFILAFARRFYYNRKRLKRVFVLSKNAVNGFSKQFSYPKNLVIYTPNGLDKASVYTDTMHYGESKSFIYGYSGTLYEFQGVGVILKYAKDILAIAPDVKLMIVGGGPMEADVRAFVEDNSLQERVIVTGSVSQEKFDELTQSFDVMLMPRPSTPSTESAVPLKIFDAAIHKKPVVMSNVSGLTEAFSDKAALVYDTRTPEKFVECCEMLYRNNALAQKLVEGEEEALANWPTVDEVAAIQLNEMQDVLNKR